MTDRQLTSFEHVLLGLICMTPSSGYDLKRMFAVTPLGVYQPSSGALYPALRRLEQKGLVRAQAPADSNGQSARHRRVYEPTQAARIAHLGWLRTPVAPATVSPDLGLHLMRFVMMEHLLPPDEVLAFLQGLADALAAFTSRLEQFAATTSISERHPLLAMDQADDRGPVRRSRSQPPSSLMLHSGHAPGGPCCQ
jgi:DNA-binding PadR family transcriptional regulator